MIRYLKSGQGDFHEQAVTMRTNSELQVTKTGKVEREPGSRKLYQILAADLQARERAGTLPELVSKLQELKIPTDGSPPEVKLLDKSTRDWGTEQRIQFESSPEIWLDATLYLPSSQGRHPAVLMVKGGDLWGVMSITEIAEKMAKWGRSVLVMEPRKSQMKTDGGPYTGDWVTNAQANMVGLNLPALRAHDILRGVDLLAHRSDVDPTSIRAATRGVDGIWLLLAAASDARIGRIWLDRTPYSLRAALDTSITSDLWDAVIPNFILHWDLQDLVKAMEGRQAIWTDPTNWMGRVVTLPPPFRYRYVLGDTTDLATNQDDDYIHELIQ
jgi:hypothetical protein